MRRIEPERRTDSITPHELVGQQRLPAQATIAIRRDTVRRHAKRLSAVIWIIMAWLVGTLISELNLIGAEPTPQLSNTQLSNTQLSNTQLSDSETSHSGPSVRPKSMLHQWASQETEYAITHSGLDAFDRVHRNHHLRQLLDALIDQETRRRSIAAVSPATDKTTKPAAERTTKLQTQSVAKADIAPVPSPAAVTAPDAGAKPTAAIPKPFATPTAVAKTDDEPVAIASNDAKAQPRDQSTASPELNASTAPDPSVKMAFEESSAQQEGGTPDQTKTQIAWKGFPKDSLPGIVSLVVHSFNELMSPVHVRPLATDDEVISVADQTSEPGSSIAYVEADTLGTERSSESPEMVVAEEPLVGAEEPFVDAEPSQDLPQTAPQTAARPAEIVRFRPLLLQVPETSVMLPSARSERVAASDTPPDHAAQQDAKLAEPRLAAKWPFERAVTNNSSMVTLNVDNADVRTVFEMLARGYQMNILVSPDVIGTVTANVDGLTPGQTLDGIVKMCNLNMQQDENLIYIYPSTQLPADARHLRVFPLDFARADYARADRTGPAITGRKRVCHQH